MFKVGDYVKIEPSDITQIQDENVKQYIGYSGPIVEIVELFTGDIHRISGCQIYWHEENLILIKDVEIQINENDILKLL